MAVEVIPSRQATREIAALETSMAALAHATRQPIALELAGTPRSRHFILRAGDSIALGHLIRQIRARWPQALIHPLTREADPLRVAPGEAISALELRPGGGADLPYHVPGEHELSQEGADPLLGLLAAFGALPPRTRAVAQLALVPAPDTWSAPHQRRAVEHPLEPERARERLHAASARLEIGGGGAIGLPAALGLLALLSIVILAQRNAKRFPTWLRRDTVAWLHRGTVHLTTGQIAWLITCGAGLLLGLFTLLLAFAWLHGRMRCWLEATPLYDQQLVQEKTARIAYRSRLRLFVIGPAHVLAANALLPATRERRAWAPRMQRTRTATAAPRTPTIPVAVEPRTAGVLSTGVLGPMPSLPSKVASTQAFALVPSRRAGLAPSSLPAWLGAGWFGQLPSHLRVRYEIVRQVTLPRILVAVLRMRTSRRGTFVRRLGRRWWLARKQSWQRNSAVRMDTRSQAASRRRVLEGFLGAYRQFHLATGAYFVPRWLPERKALHLMPFSTQNPASLSGGRATRAGEYGEVQDGAGVPLDTPLEDSPLESVSVRACKTDALAARLGLRRWRTESSPIGQMRWQRGLRRSAHVLSVADVAALWHLPQAADLVDLPFVQRTRARTLLVPEALTYSAHGFRVGTSAHAGHILPVCLPPDATRRNALAIAKTGKGKSTLLLSLAQAALADTSGLVLIDPHGDLAETVLLHVPERRRDEVVLVDLGDREYPIGLNPLDTTLFPDRDKAVSNMIAVFSQIWKDFWGPRMESALEAALKTLYEVNQAEVAQDPQDGPDRQHTLLDATPLMTFGAFRHSLMAQVRDPALKEYWMRFDALQPRLQQDIITPVTTKLDKFANSFVARRIVGQGRSTLNVAEAVRQGQILIVKTARGVVGQDTAALIGATLLGMLQVTLAEQVAVDLAHRQRVRVVVDEFQTLPGVDFGAMLSELRKFGASFALATQALAHLDALDRALRPTVLSNVDQLFAFAMSAEDARLLVRELDGVVEEPDLIALDDFACYVRLTADGQRVPVFTLTLDAPSPADDRQRGQAEMVRQRSQRRIGRWVETVDAVITDAAIRRKMVAEQQQHDTTHAQRQGNQQAAQGTQMVQESSPPQGHKRGTNRWRKKKSSHGFVTMSPTARSDDSLTADTNAADGSDEADDDSANWDADSDDGTERLEEENDNGEDPR